MHNPAELNESLERRIDLLTEKVLFLEQQVKSLTDSQGGEIPPGMAPVSTLAAEFGISTKKAEELAKNTGVMMVKMCIRDRHQGIKTGSTELGILLPVGWKG